MVFHHVSSNKNHNYNVKENPSVAHYVQGIISNLDRPCLLQLPAMFKPSRFSNLKGNYPASVDARVSCPPVRRGGEKVDHEVIVNDE